MHQAFHFGVLRYGVAVVTVLLAAAVTYWVPWLRHREVFILPVGAVAISAWYGGSGPALTACIVGALLQNFLAYEPFNTFSFTLEALIPMFFFLIVALTISRLTTALVAAREKAREQRHAADVALSELSLAEERQRRAIAVGLHDSVGVSLGLTRIKLGTLRSQFSDAEIVRQFDEIGQLMKQVIGEIRTLTFEISPPILYEVGLEAALEWLANHMEKSHQLKCSFATRGSGAALPQELDVVLFQIARELLVNVVKHARASSATLELARESHSVRLTVQDDGSGFDSSAVTQPSKKTLGFGLFSMRDRVRLLDGTFAIESRPGRGTSVTVTLPAPA